MILDFYYWLRFKLFGIPKPYTVKQLLETPTSICNVNWKDTRDLYKKLFPD